MKNSSSELQALQRVVTTTRFLASTGTDGTTIARILDETDYLISLLRHGEDHPNHFGEVLGDIGRKFPELAYIANEYACPQPV